ncbi:hypothetical protein N7455_010060 [Penicillium solitum]|uniref:uncharacterized protein n=1 Tax=Penicillium solitum TaxID=60172 RepID=UPI0032C4281E|nr:hypothetical protein N7455_010060 [Penicillium solitum]
MVRVIASDWRNSSRRLLRHQSLTITLELSLENLHRILLSLVIFLGTCPCDLATAIDFPHLLENELPVGLLQD